MAAMECSLPMSKGAKWTVTLEKLDKGFEVQTRVKEKDERVSVRAGWIPPKYKESRQAFDKIKDALNYIENSCEKEEKK